MEPDAKVWQQVCSERGLCSPKMCGFQSDFVKDGGDACFFQWARSRILAADVLVLNHTLFFMQLGMAPEEAGSGLLFKNDFVIFDEAHTGRAGSLAPHRVERLQRPTAIQFYSGFGIPLRNKGLLALLRKGRAIGLVEAALLEADNFFAAVEEECDRIYGLRRRRSRGGARVERVAHSPARPCPGQSQPASAKLARGDCANRSSWPATRTPRRNWREANLRLGELCDQLVIFLKQGAEKHVYWVERAGKLGRNITLNAAPINVAEFLRKRLFGSETSVIMTSATLATVKIIIRLAPKPVPPRPSKCLPPRAARPLPPRRHWPTSPARLARNRPGCCRPVRRLITRGR